METPELSCSGFPQINQPMTAVTTTNSKNTVWFYLLFVYLLFEYGRLHVTLNIDFARPIMILIVIFTGMILLSNQLFTLKNKQVTLLWMFIFLLALFIPFARNNFYAYQCTKTMLLYMPFIVSVIICVNTIERLKMIVFICVLIMMYISIYAITHHGHGPGNYFLDENDLSLYINMWIPFCYFLFFYEEKWVLKLLYAVSLILGLAAVVVSFSRGGFIGLIAVALTIVMFSKRRLISLAIILITILFIILFSDESYKSEMKTITDTKESTAIERIESWKSGWNMFLDNPLGVGGNNFLVRFDEYQTDYFKRGMWGRVAHSIWFTLLPELGLGGVIIFGFMLYYNIRDAFHLKRISIPAMKRETIYLNQLGQAFIASLAGFFASATFLSVLYYAHYWYMLGFIVAATSITKEMQMMQTIHLQKSE